MKHARLFVGLALALLAASCGGGGGTTTETETETTTTTVGGKSGVRVYWLREGKVWPVGREVDTTGGVVNGTVAQLLVGPTDEERKELDAKTAIPGDVTRAEITTADDVATVELPAKLPRSALAQLVFTLTQFRTVDSVVVAGTSYTRHSFEDATPAILVESPLAFEEVTSPLRARGTANTFEATFDYELEDSSGKTLAKHFVTATSGNGMRGTFVFKAPFQMMQSGEGTLTVYEVSAENGRRIHSVSIPLRLRAR